MKGFGVIGMLLGVALIAGFAIVLMPRLLSSPVGDSGIVPGDIVGENPLVAANDTQRITHLKQFQTALEIYFTEYGMYPSTSNSRVDISEATEPCKTLLAGNYLSSCYTDPSGMARYQYRSDGATFAVEAVLQNDESPFCETDTSGDCVRTLHEDMGTNIVPEDF